MLLPDKNYKSSRGKGNNKKEILERFIPPILDIIPESCSNQRKRLCFATNY